MKASAVKDGKLVIDGENCNNCGRCVGKCPFHALDEGTYGYKIYIGGRWGKRTATGRPLSKLITTKEEALRLHPSLEDYFLAKVRDKKGTVIL